MSLTHPQAKCHWPIFLQAKCHWPIFLQAKCHWPILRLNVTDPSFLRLTVVPESVVTGRLSSNSPYQSSDLYLMQKSAVSIMCVESKEWMKLGGKAFFCFIALGFLEHQKQAFHDHLIITTATPPPPKQDTPSPFYLHPGHLTATTDTPPHTHTHLNPCPQLLLST